MRNGDFIIKLQSQNPGEVRMPGRLYDDLVEHAKDVIERNRDED